MPPQPVSPTVRIGFWRRCFNWLCYSIFWGWNLGSLLLIYLGLFPFVGIALLLAMGEDILNLELLLTFLLLLLVPVASTLWAMRRGNHRPGRLMQLFFGLEAPLILLCLVRLFVFRQMPAASLWMAITFVVALLAYGIHLVGPERVWRRLGGWLQLTGHSLLLGVGVYGGILLSLYVPLMVMVVLRACLIFFRFGWLDGLRYTPLELIPFLLIVYGGAALVIGGGGLIFILLPFAMTWLYLRAGWKTLTQLASTWGSQRTGLGVATVLGIWLAISAILYPQPQVQAFALLRDPPVSDQARQELIQDSDLIREGLLNAYLSSYRYLSPEAETHNLRELYWDSVKLPRPWGDRLQALHNALLSPFLYQGSLRDPAEAGVLYEQFFDIPIQKAEAPTIRTALESTVNRDQIQAGLLDIDQQRVWLAKQEIQVQPQADIAEIEIHEIYDNNTSEQQEVFYGFSLPETAVITGLWLGETEDLGQRYTHVVAPRGAAQQVYTQEVQRQVDPALLEQVGPQQYRLRAFPVPPQQIDPENLSQRIPGRMHLWMTYQVMADVGGWPLPHLLEQRNIYWTAQTERWQNGEPTSQLLDQWFPPYLSATPLPNPQAHQITLTTDDETYTISAYPFQEERIPQNRRFALVLDTSRSMWQQRGSLTETFQWLNTLFVPNNQVDLYLSASAGRDPQFLGEIAELEQQAITFYGSLTLPQILNQFETMRAARSYDAILLVTDAGTYEVSSQDLAPEVDSAALDAPLWMVHLGDLPLAYEDPILAAITDSRGGVGTSIQTVMTRLETQLSQGSTVLDGYRWQLEDSGSEVVRETDRDPFAPLAARYGIRALGYRQTDRNLDDLDRIHAIATRHDIVTPFSSMLVLVNDRQREALAAAEAADDRFEREVETGSETLTQPFSPFVVTGVPEPEEWVLISCVLLLGAGILYRRRLNIRSVGEV